jgi:hypothetical protein
MSQPPQSLTRVNTIHTSPLRTKASRRADASTGRYRFKNSDLPPGTADHFAKEVLPLAFDTAGALGPWECPDDEDIITIWNLVFSSPDNHSIASGDVKGAIFLAVKGLVSPVYYSLIMSLTIVCPGQAGYLNVASQILYSR